jgi:hypothetical protein
LSIYQQSELTIKILLNFFSNFKRNTFAVTISPITYLSGSHTYATVSNIILSYVWTPLQCLFKISLFLKSVDKYMSQRWHVWLFLYLIYVSKNCTYYMDMLLFWHYNICIYFLGFIYFDKPRELSHELFSSWPNFL